MKAEVLFFKVLLEPAKSRTFSKLLKLLEAVENSVIFRK